MSAIVVLHSERPAADTTASAIKLSVSVGSYEVGEEIFNIGRVKSAHHAWRSRLEGVLKGASTLQKSGIASHHECDFGKWYDRPQGQRFANLHIYK